MERETSIEDSLEDSYSKPYWHRTGVANAASSASAESNQGRIVKQVCYEGDNLATGRVRLTPPLLRGFEAYTTNSGATHSGGRSAEVKPLTSQRRSAASNRPPRQGAPASARAAPTLPLPTVVGGSTFRGSV